MLYSPARDQLVKSLHLLKVDRPKKYRVLYFCSVKASNLCLRLITLNLYVCINSSLNSMIKQLFRGGGGFNQYDDIHVTTQEVHIHPWLCEYMFFSGTEIIVLAFKKPKQ